MADFSAGLFFMMMILSFGFMFLGFTRYFNFTKFFSIMSFAVFLGLSLMVPGNEIVSEKTITDGTDTWTERQIIIGTDGYWLSYVFIGLSILNFVLFINNIWRTQDN